MKIANLNVNFFPNSYGGATIVAEKLALGLANKGHEVFNISLAQEKSPLEFECTEDRYGTNIKINNIYHSVENRLINTPASSLITELLLNISPDIIIVHAVQHMGISECLLAEELYKKTVIIAHDHFWICAQGFRTLPSGKKCTRVANPQNCRLCAWYGGMLYRIYESHKYLLENCHKVIYPSKFLKDSYSDYIENTENQVVISNPDSINYSNVSILESQNLESVPKIKFAYFGGPGDQKGWDLVKKFIAHSDAGSGHEVILVDAGKIVASPWYDSGVFKNASVRDPFHWSDAQAFFEEIHCILMPSNVDESFGLVAREALSLNKKVIVRGRGALKELEGYRYVYFAEAFEDNVDALLKAVRSDNNTNLPKKESTTIDSYTNLILKQINDK